MIASVAGSDRRILGCAADLIQTIRWPDYARCLEQFIARGAKRTSADFTLCCMAIDLYRKTPEATADKLMELSTKAQENGYLYSLGQAQRAAEKVAINPRRRF